MSRFVGGLSTLMMLVCSFAIGQTSVPVRISAVPPSPTMEAAKLSNHVYDLQIPPGASVGHGLTPLPQYRILGAHNDLASGFQAVAYQHEQTKQVTVAFRGTNERADWVANQGIGRSEYRGLRAFDLQSQTPEDRQFNTQVQQAQGFTDRIRQQVRVTDPTAEVTLTGHSLGGALAQVEGARTGLKTTTFNAPGMTNTIKRLYPNARTDHIHNHVRNEDFASAVSTQAGNIYRYPDRDAQAMAGSGSVPVNVTPFRQPQWYHYNHSMGAFYVDLMEGMTTNDGQRPDQASATDNSSRRAALHGAIARQNELSAANRATTAAQQGAGHNPTYMNEMMLRLLPAAIATQQQRTIQPPLAAPVPELQYRPPVYPGSAASGRSRTDPPSIGSTFGSPPSAVRGQRCTQNLDCRNTEIGPGD